MDSSIKKRAGEFLQEKSRRRRWQKTVAVLAVLVIFATVWVLLVPASALVKRVYCGMEEHIHDDACYELVLVCGYADEALGEADGETGSQESVTAPEDAGQQSGQTPESGMQTGETAQPHRHEDSCYAEERQLICGQTELMHTHTDACYNVTVTEELVCGQTETEGHTHSEACYTDSSELTCGQEESEEHTHTDECYTGKHELTCGREESQGHAHTNECYAAKENRELTCGQEEGAPEEGSHIHSESCYQNVHVLICGQEEADQEGGAVAGQAQEPPAQQEPAADMAAEPATEPAGNAADTQIPADTASPADGGADSAETSSDAMPEGEEPAGEEEEHVHTEECYALAPVCGYEEHTHEDLCYEVPFCGITAHVHVPGCYDEEGSLICGEEEHRHDEACYKEPHCGITVHIHGDDCYDEGGNLTCEAKEHLHTKLCYFEMPHYYCVDRMHIHTQACMDENGNIACGYANFAVHTHDEECYLSGASLLHGEGDAEEDAALFAGLTPEEDLICTLPEIEAHEHTAECYAPNEETGEQELVCEKPEIILHEHTEECYDIERNLICGKIEVLEHHHFDECYIELEEVEEVVKIFETEGLRVVAVYTTNANIPEEAELIAEEITPESDEEHYASREAEYQEIMGSKYAAMRALLRVGFYVDGVEVEPEEPVTLTVQFLDENGLEEGSPITVIHFGEEGTEVLEGSDAQDGSTSFELNSFSEIAIGYTEIEEKFDEARVLVSKSCEYTDALFHAIFRINGEVVIPTQLLAQAGGETEEAVSGGDAWTPGEAGERTVAEDGTVILTLAEEELPGVLAFNVELLDEKVEEYKAAAAVYEEDPEEAEVYLNQVLAYYLTYDGVKLDLTGSKVTVEVTPTPALVDYAEETVGVTPDGEEIQAEVTFSLINIMRETDTVEMAGADEAEPAAEDETESAGEETDTSDAEGDENGESISDETWGGTEEAVAGEVLAAETVTGGLAPITATLNAAGTENAVAARAESQANPKFTVEFYANVKRVIFSDTEKSGYLPMIDTTGRALPTNGGNMVKKYVEIQNNQVQEREELTEVYSPEEYRYIEAPGLTYFNKLAKNSNYILKEIQVKRSGIDTWESYSCWSGTEKREWHFTNRQETKDKYKDEFILIDTNATVRLIYDVSEDEVSNGANFYDYDISDGKVYLYNRNTGSLTEGERKGAKTHEGGAVWYMYTNRQGINGNLKDQTFGFGNSESLVKTTMGEIPGNRSNSVNSNYGGATFGLVTGLQGGRIQYAGNVKAPNLFNDGGATGKSSYAGDLVFKQRGDTYTLTAAHVRDGETVSSVSNLDKFRQQWNWNNTRYFMTNDFYPVDTVGSAGKVDLMFGSPASVSVIRNTSQKKGEAGKDLLSLPAPASDDKKNHNHYFGMHYTIGFDLVEDYIGPLEYLFYGDDDMWVFLDGPGYSGQLVCDIGGVHSSIGEYVDLWDYIKKGSKDAEGHYTLTFFYTERGASGSTCWMQFTLPSVSFATTRQDTGELRIEKQVSGEKIEEEFGFEVHFYEDSHIEDPNNVLRDSYSYTKYKVGTDEVVANDVLIWDDAKFTLKADEYIVISLLPDGSYYSISEVGPVTVLPKEPGETVEWEVNPENPYYPEISRGGQAAGTDGTITGKVTKNTQVEIRYNNIQKFELPETGGKGIRLYTIAGALFLTLGAGLLYKKKYREGRARELPGSGDAVSKSQINKKNLERER